MLTYLVDMLQYAWKIILQEFSVILQMKVETSYLKKNLDKVCLFLERRVLSPVRKGMVMDSGQVRWL